ncbi:rhodanese-like domain-containing protein [Limibacter armeniacum]|uniref:rhodanese-like domain-containing protein n=1 Tax=Limibacter armeniacum TaxID=466084 RepID=UPI002FE6B947
MLEFIKNLFGGDQGFETLDDEAFAEKLKGTEKPIILDVRSRMEHKEEKLHNALNIDVMSPNFVERLKHMDKDKPYFVYCKSGNRSKRACKMMAKEGFTELYNLKGGIIAWSGKTV